MKVKAKAKTKKLVGDYAIDDKYEFAEKIAVRKARLKYMRLGMVLYTFILIGVVAHSCVHACTLKDYFFSCLCTVGAWGLGYCFVDDYETEIKKDIIRRKKRLHRKKVVAEGLKAQKGGDHYE